MMTIRRVLKVLPVYPILRRGYRSIIRLGASDEQWARVVMNRETRKMIEILEPKTLKALEISGYSWGNRVSFKEYRHVDYPDFDICQAPLEETFDLIIAEQVFEHLLWPYRAGKNVYRMLKPGGHLLVTTPFLLRIHDYPTDCCRWTETGLKYLLAECGFDAGGIQTGSWGNRACIRANFSGWPMYRPWFHSLRNEYGFPIVVWALSKK